MPTVLFICDPLDGFKIKTDTTYSLMVNAADMGFDVFYCLPSQLYTLKNHVYANITKLTILVKPNQDDDSVSPWYTVDNFDKQIQDGLHQATNKDSNPDIHKQELAKFSNNIYYHVNLNAFNCVMVRNDPPFNMEYYYLTQFMTLAENNGACIVNNSYSLRNYNEKLAILNFPELIPNTIVTKDKHTLLGFLEKHKECVIKPLDLMAGRGIFKITKLDVNCDVILETSTQYFTQTVMLQEFIPEVSQGDKRIFIINGEIIDYCLWRIPVGNRIRGNIAAGGRGEVYKLTPEDYTLAKQVAKWIQKNKIVFCGLDVIGNKLTEINITSPTGTKQILQHANINIPKLILKPYINK